MEVLDGAPAPGKRRQSFFDTALKVESKAKARATAFAQKKRKERADALQAVEDSRKVKTTDISFFFSWKRESERSVQSFYRTAERVGRAFVGVFISVSRGVFASKRDGQVFKERRKKEERIYVLTSAAIHKLLFFLFMQYRSWRVLHCLQPLHCSLSLYRGAAALLQPGVEQFHTCSSRSSHYLLTSPLFILQFYVTTCKI